MTCKNCTTNYNGNYCPNCGQKATDIKYSMKGLISDLFFSALHVEKKGLIFTFKELTLRPGDSIRKVIRGQRLYLYPPFKYLVLIGAIILVLSVRYKFFHNEYTQVGNSDTWLSDFILPEHLAYLESFFRFAEEEATILNIATIPVFAFASWSIVSYKRFNFAENLVINTFITAQQLFFLALLSPLIEFFPGIKVEIIGAYSFLTVLYNLLVYQQIFSSTTGKILTLAKSILAIMVAFAYQIPVNLLIYYLYDNFLSPYKHLIH